MLRLRDTPGKRMGVILFILSPLALIVAMAVRSFLVPSPNMKSFYRIAFFLPNLTSFVVIALMFTLIFNKDFGLLNQALQQLGLAALVLPDVTQFVDEGGLFRQVLRLRCLLEANHVAARPSRP